MIEAELHDGRVLEFPDGTSPDVVKATVKKVLGEQAKPAATGADRLKALQGGLYRGAAGIAGLPMDTVENVYNLGKAAIGTVAGAAGRPDLMPEPTRGTPLGSEWIARQMERIGINTQNPRPDDRPSRFLNTAGLITGGSAVPGSTVGGTVKSALGGAVAEQIDPRLTALGAMAPAVGSQVGAELKNAIAAKTAPNVQAFKDSGTMPSVGQATESSFFRGLENLAAKFPGGVGVMRNFADAQQKQIGQQARTGVSAETAGRTIEGGITGKGGFLERTKQTWQNLDNEVAAKIPQGSSFRLPNTVQTVVELTQPVRGAEKTTAALVNPKIAEIRANIADDLKANGGVMPFEAIRALRSRVGSMLDDALVSGVPNGELKKLYGGLSKDLEAAATQAGAGKEFARQNDFYRSRMERIETVLNRVIGKNKQPEDIFKAFNPTDPDQANKARAVMRSLEPSERKIVADAVVNRLGRATPGKQDEFGEVFSSETFLTNWNKLSPAAKSQLFPDQAMRSNLDSIAKVSSNIREGSKTFANPSGTAGAAAPYGLGALALTGNWLAAGGLLTSAYVGSKMMTNPAVVNWLAKSATVKPIEATSHLAKLGVIYNNTSDPQLRAELDKYMESVNKGAK